MERRSHDSWVQVFANSRRIREFLQRSRQPKSGRLYFSSIVDPLFPALLAFDVLILRQRKAIQIYESDTWNVARGRSWVSSNSLDLDLARWTGRSNGNSKRSAFRF